ncbi:MAG: thioredoxin family protein [Erythrobacter sp.]|nr:thioredoxin family protein [Erythrobacter sp.]
MLKLSRQVDYGAAPHPFALPDTTGTLRSLDEFIHGKGLLVTFICNHCPFVLHLLDGLIEFANEYTPQGLQVVAISANDAVQFPEDSPRHMAILAAERHFPFPYLHDETQEVALAYGAICTPDFFLYARGADGAMQLAYCGQFDPSRPPLPHPPLPGTEMYRRSLPVTGVDLRRAADAVLADQPAPQPQVPSAGCSIEWKPGKAPGWG